MIAPEQSFRVRMRRMRPTLAAMFTGIVEEQGTVQSCETVPTEWGEGGTE